MIKDHLKSLRYFCTAVLLLCISLMSVIGGINFAKAEKVTLSTREKFEQIDLMTELKDSVDKNGKPFDINEYPYDTAKGELRVFTVAEFMYDNSSSENYGIYVYLYNPKKLTLDEETANRVSTAT